MTTNVLMFIVKKDLNGLISLLRELHISPGLNKNWEGLAILRDKYSVVLVGWLFLFFFLFVLLNCSRFGYVLLLENMVGKM